MEAFRNSLEFYSFNDNFIKGKKLTWLNNRRGSDFIKERLDRAMANLK